MKNVTWDEIDCNHGNTNNLLIEIENSESDFAEICGGAAKASKVILGILDLLAAKKAADKFEGDIWKAYKEFKGAGL